MRLHCLSACDEAEAEMSLMRSWTSADVHVQHIRVETGCDERPSRFRRFRMSRVFGTEPAVAFSFGCSQEPSRDNALSARAYARVHYVPRQSRQLPPTPSHRPQPSSPPS